MWVELLLLGGGIAFGTEKEMEHWKAWFLHEPNSWVSEDDGSKMDEFIFTVDEDEVMQFAKEKGVKRLYYASYIKYREWDQTDEDGEELYYDDEHGVVFGAVKYIDLKN